MGRNGNEKERTMWKNYKPSELTAETDDYDLDKPVEAARNRLYQMVAERAGSRDLARYLNALAEAEGQAFVAKTYVRYIKNGATPAEAASEIMSDLMGLGADDTWSGRENDTARALFNGKREMATALFNHYIKFATV